MKPMTIEEAKEVAIRESLVSATGIATKIGVDSDGEELKVTASDGEVITILRVRGR